VVRRSPNSCTSSAPNVDTPTSVTHTGLLVARSISAISRPLVDVPVVPVEREAVHGHHVDEVDEAVAADEVEPPRVDRRHAPEHDRQAGRERPDAPRRAAGHGAELLPPGSTWKVPVRLVVRLVPELDGFDHGAVRGRGVRWA
jgi:hypothetical protein